MDFNLDQLLQSMQTYGANLRAGQAATVEAHRRLVNPPVPVANMIVKPDPTLGEHFQNLDKQEGLPPRTLLAISTTETGGEADPIHVQNSKDAAGIFQQREIFRKTYGITDSTNPLIAGAGTAKAMKSLIKRFGNVELALAAYNWGPGNLRKANLDLSKAPRETQEYVQNAMAIIRGEKPLRGAGKTFKDVLNKPITEWKNGKKD